MGDSDRLLRAPTVIYVPPTTGSDIRVWNADMPPNWIVPAKDCAIVSSTRQTKKPAEIGGLGNQYTIMVARNVRPRRGQHA